MLIEQIKEMILKIVEEHSGGIKFTELINELVKNYYIKQSDNEEFPKASFFHAIIKDIPELNILTFTFKPLNREKMFIYTP